MTEKQIAELKKMRIGDQITWTDPKTKKDTIYEIKSIKFLKKIATIKGKSARGGKMSLEVDLDS